MTTERIVYDCGHLESEHSECTRGYAVESETGRKICYDCALEADKAALLKDSRFIGYLSRDGRKLTNWVGRELGTVTRTGETHPFSTYDKRRYIRVLDCHGQMWHGTGAAGMWASLRKCKKSV